MPDLHVNGSKVYYEQAGEAPALVFIHGAFCDARMWDPQWEYFAPNYPLLRYDLRGHGRTGTSALDRYTINTFADDLSALLDALGAGSVALCGQSFGGSIAQAFAVRHPERVRALVIAGSMVAVDLSPTDKFLCRVLVPEWAMTTLIRTLSVEKFTRFSLWLGRLSKGKDFLSLDETTTEYLEQCMFQMDRSEYLKFWRALYNFHLLPLERIPCPTLVLNGEFEPRSMVPHTKELLRRIPRAEAKLVPAARHASNMDNPQAFNQLVEEFLCRAGCPKKTT